MIQGNPKTDQRRRPSNRLAAFSLVELLMVIALIGILAGVAITRIEPSLHGKLESAAQIVVSDLAAARNLAVTYNSSYQITFDRANNRYLLEHSGSNSTLDELPASAFDATPDRPKQRTTDLDDFPTIGAPPRIVVAYKVTSDEEGNETFERIDQLEFGPLGGTTEPEPTVVWLACQESSAGQFVAIHVDPVTGLASIGEFALSLDGGGEDDEEDMEGSDDGGGESVELP